MANERTVRYGLIDGDDPITPETAAEMVNTMGLIAVNAPIFHRTPADVKLASAKLPEGAKDTDRLLVVTFEVQDFPADGGTVI